MLHYGNIYLALSGLVGLRQTKEPDVPLIDHTLTLSNSGLFVNDLALNWLTNKHLNLVIDDFATYNFPAWNAGDSYFVGQRLQYNGDVYVALLESSGVQPDSNPTEWRRLYALPSLSTWLTEAKEAAIRELVNAVLAKNENYNGSQVLSPNGMGTAIEGNVEMRLAKEENRFFGYALRPCQRNDVQLQLRKVGLRVDTPQVLTFYLFHYSQSTALATYNVEILPNEAGKFVWKDLVDAAGNPIILDYHRADKNAGGDYTLGIFRGDIAGPVYEQVLTSYSETYHPRLNRFQGFFDLDLIEVPERFVSPVPGGLFDVNQIEYQREQALFNLDLVAYADATYQIVSGARLWARGVQLAIAVKLLSEMYQSQQLNRIASEAYREIGFLLYGNKAEEISGLKHQYWAEVKKLVAQYEGAKADGFENRVRPRVNYY